MVPAAPPFSLSPPFLSLSPPTPKLRSPPAPLSCCANVSPNFPTSALIPSRSIASPDASPDTPDDGPESPNVGTLDRNGRPLLSDAVNVLVLTTATLTQSAHAMTRVRAPSHHAMCGSYAPGGGLPRGLSTYAIRASRASS